MRGGIALCALVALGACGQRDSRQHDSVPVRIPLAVASAATPEVAAVPILPGIWTWSPARHTAWYGPRGGSAYLAIECQGAERNAGRLIVRRAAPTQPGAKAFFAFQGSDGILRLPVDAASDGHGGLLWQGTLDAGDPRARVLLGHGLRATVPGGGMLELPPLGPASAVVSQCIASAPPLPPAPVYPKVAEPAGAAPSDEG